MAQAAPITAAEVARYTSARDYLGALQVFLLDFREHIRTRIPIGARESADEGIAIILNRIQEWLRTLDYGWTHDKKRETLRASVQFTRAAQRAVQELVDHLRAQENTIEGTFWSAYTDLRTAAGNVVRAGAVGIGVTSLVVLLLAAWAFKGR